MEETVSGFIPIGNGAPTLRWKMAASQTIKKGDPVILTSGLVAKPEVTTVVAKRACRISWLIFLFMIVKIINRSWVTNPNHMRMW